jgi:ribosome assembly protein YihI (activator of Der GTPase)
MNNTEDNDIPLSDGEMRILLKRLGSIPLVLDELVTEKEIPNDRPSVRYLVAEVYKAVDHLEELEINDVVTQLLGALARYEAAMAQELC